MQRINTATKSVDLFGAGKHGFTDGNAQGNTPPTQFSADWCNAVQEAIARSIEAAGITLADDHTQLWQAIEKMVEIQQPRYNSDRIFYWRAQSDGALSTNGEDSKEWKYAAFLENAAAGSSNDVIALGAFSGKSYQMNGEFRVCVVQTDDIANYANVTINFSARHTGATVTLQSSNSDVLNDNVCGATISAIASGPSLVCRVALPAAPVGKVYNVWAKMVLNTVRIT